MRDNQDRLGWIAPLIVGLLFRGALLLSWEGATTDGITRTLYAGQWLAGEKALFGLNTWPELNYLLPALAIKLGGDFYWAPRTLYALISLLAIPVMYLTVQHMFDRRSAAIASWCIALLPQIAVFSTSGARSEMVAATGTLIAILGMLRWNFGEGSYTDVLIAVAGVAITEGMRFDGVLVGAALGFVLLLELLARRDGASRARRAAGMTIFGAACLIYPISLALSWNSVFGDPLHFLHTAQVNSQQFMAAGGHARWPAWLYRSYAFGFLPFAMGYVLTPVLFSLGVLGIWRAKVTWRTAGVLALLTVQMGFIVKNVVEFTQQPQLRYALPLALLVVPFIGGGVETVEKWFARSASLRSQAKWWLLAAVTSSVVGVELLAGAATVRDLGVISRQLRGTGLVQRDQFTSRDAMRFVMSAASPGDSVLVTPFVESPYSELADAFRDRRIGVARLPIYRTGNLVYEFEDYCDTLDRRLANMRFVLVNRGWGVQGFAGGVLKPDPLGSQVVGDSMTAFVWRGHRFRVMGRFGSQVVLEQSPRE